MRASSSTVESASARARAAGHPLARTPPASGSDARPRAAWALAALLAVLLPGCGDSLVDHAAAGLGLTDGGGGSPDGGGPDGGGCAVEDASSCGPVCAPCPTIANATASCLQNSCAYRCADGWLRTSTGCAHASAIAAGGDNSCAIVQGGEVRCWGANDHGQLGSATTAAFSRVPVGVAGIAGATAISVGTAHACALTSNGVSCWGANGSGQLGQAGADSPAPVAVSLPAGVQLLAAGGRHTCAATGSGVYCWGANDLSQLGGASLTAAVPDLTSLSGLAAGRDHTCAIAAGALRCWGANSAGQLASGANSSAEAQPTEPFASGTTALALGSAHSCAINASKLFCWGDGTLGQLGDRLQQSSPTPVEPSGVSNPGALAAGGGHSCVAFSGGGGGGSSNLSCWGANSSGQLGIGSTVQQLQAAKVSLLGVDSVAAGASHTCALIAGAVSCWGANDRGQAGSGTDPQLLSPATVSGN